MNLQRPGGVEIDARSKAYELIRSAAADSSFDVKLSDLVDVRRSCKSGDLNLGDVANLKIGMQTVFKAQILGPRQIGDSQFHGQLVGDRHGESHVL